MKKGISTASVFLLVFIFSCCQSGNHKFDNSILWEIKSGKTGKTSYVLGTQHIMDTTKIRFPIRQIEQLIDRTQYMYVELNAAQKRQGSYQMLKSEYVMADPDAPKLPDCLNQKYQRKLKSIIESSEFILPKIDAVIPTLSPQALSLFLSMEKSQSTFAKGTFSPDSYFESYAKNNYKGILSLEKTSDQMKWLMQPEMKFTDAIKLLEKQIDVFSIDLGNLYDLYKNQKIAVIASIAASDSINIMRNHNMVRLMDISMQDYSIFTVVGAAHLSGDDGILALLEEKGYEIMPVKVDLKR